MFFFYEHFFSGQLSKLLILISLIHLLSFNIMFIKIKNKFGSMKMAQSKARKIINFKTKLRIELRIHGSVGGLKEPHQWQLLGL